MTEKTDEGNAASRVGFVDAMVFSFGQIGDVLVDAHFHAEKGEEIGVDERRAQEMHVEVGERRRVRPHGCDDDVVENGIAEELESLEGLRAAGVRGVRHGFDEERFFGEGICEDLLDGPESYR